MKRMASALIASVALAACATEMPERREPENFETSIERSEARAEAAQEAQFERLCGRDAECLDQQRAAHGRMQALYNRAMIQSRWWNGALFTFQGPTPEARAASSVILDAIAYGRAHTMPKERTYDYVAAEEWTMKALEGRGVDLTAECLVPDRVLEGEVLCLDNYDRRWVKIAERK